MKAMVANPARKVARAKERETEMSTGSLSAIEQKTMLATNAVSLIATTSLVRPHVQSNRVEGSETAENAIPATNTRMTRLNVSV